MEASRINEQPELKTKIQQANETFASSMTGKIAEVKIFGSDFSQAKLKEVQNCAIAIQRR
ncbi:hypothetical protein H6S82_15715 [Planktothrix sp. FACHB-1355]|uniref:Uncharacterized protein n=1 Tax=Aerosakkonema funiforme FACHB-1375 TaxID=2949571 RepID=A0A926ZJZ0_9CYAN|nr:MULTISPECIES: hypothetical protein [Oscillatoriales]MBD2185390.1 hypothetical protein [Aerosakkonema funiforme FACHB-1375]MBD3560288.1 hypothetical protein [Planktothrix sp. FACHB-1355]